MRSTTTAQLMEELENGDEAAMRFDDDLAAARALAAASPAIAQVPTESRLTAEVLILVNYVRINNAGCDDRGGFVVTRLPTVTCDRFPISRKPREPSTPSYLDPTAPEAMSSTRWSSTQTSSRMAHGTSASSSADRAGSPCRFRALAQAPSVSENIEP